MQWLHHYGNSNICSTPKTSCFCDTFLFSSTSVLKLLSNPVVKKKIFLHLQILYLHSLTVFLLLNYLKCLFFSGPLVIITILNLYIFKFSG